MLLEGIIKKRKLEYFRVINAPFLCKLVRYDIHKMNHQLWKFIQRSYSKIVTNLIHSNVCFSNDILQTN